MKRLFLGATLVTLFFSSCSLFNRNEKITDRKDYQQYLEPRIEKTQLKKIDTEISFWKKRFNSTPDDLVSRNKLASLLTQRFSYSGNVQEVHQADSLYQLVNQLNRKNSSGTFRSLAANSITQHKFQQAQLYIDSALQLGDDKYLTVLMEFDVAMELGNKYRARKALNSLVDKEAFEYLIREAKYKDHAEGDLDAAIKLMEKALEKVKELNNQTVSLWTLSNLGDMYGHANRYKESYRCYLDVLAKDPEYYHALKGIAWLAFSKDGNTADARRIIQYLQQQHPVPDYDLMLFKIASFENNKPEASQHINDFISKVSIKAYGDMYNKYLFGLQADELNNNALALSIAEKEVLHRPTGEAFSWLAWAYCKNGQNEKALQTVRYYVQNSCYEPDALYYVGKIYLANRDFKNARKFLTKAADSKYELGPVIGNDINTALKEL